MKLNCSFCGCAFDATSEKCPNCGAVNEQAAKYANQQENATKAKEEAKNEAHARVMQTQRNIKKVAFTVYGVIAVIICLPILIGVIFGIANLSREQQRKTELAKQKQAQVEEEQRQKEEQEKKQKAYDEAIVAVDGINTVAGKDQYYAIQVTDVVPYELNYDHKCMDWGGSTSEPYLTENEHRVAIQIKVQNFQNAIKLYGNPTNVMKLYIEDENADSIVIWDEDFLNGSSDDNYYSGGEMISGNRFSDKYGEALEKDQTMSWWVPVVVNESSKSIVLHFDYNISITVDNPYAK